MHSLTSWFIRNPVAANLMMLLVLVAGWFTVSSIRVEGFPKLPADTLEVTTIYPNAHVHQVDEQVTRRIERSFEGLAGVNKVTSFSSEGLSVVRVQKQEGYSLSRLSEDVRSRLDAIYGLPDKAEEPVVTRNDFDLAAMIVQLYGDTDPDTLQTIATDVRETLLALPEVSKIKTWGKRQAEIRIELNPEKLLAYQLSTDDVLIKIQQSSLSYQAGTLKTQGGDISLRADHERYQRLDFESIPIRSLNHGSELTLKDIASVMDDYEDDGSLVRFNGQPGIGLEIMIGRQENLLEIAEAVQQSLAKQRLTLPKGVSLVSWADSSHYISERLSLLKDNAVQGLLLVFVLLSLFLNIRLAFWVAMGIPIAIAGALAVMGSDWVGYSLNDITTFGLIIALGILVDDAVVVGESVFEERAKTTDPIKGTELGVRKIATATIYGVLTTIAAFFPMLLIDNAMGKILASFAGVVILTLIFSLIESKFILPAHLAAVSINNDKPAGSKWSVFTWLKRMGHGLQRLAQTALDRFKTAIYAPALVFALKQRYSVLIVFISMAILGLGMIENGSIRTVFFPDIPGQVVSVQVEMDSRAPLQLTTANAQRIEQAANELNRSWQQEHNLQNLPIRHVLMVVNNAASVEFYAELTPTHERPNLSAEEIVSQWRERVGQVEGAMELNFSASEETGGGFALQVFSKNEASLRRVSDLLIEHLNNTPGTSDVRQDLKPGQPQLRFKLTPEARYLGFSDQSLAAQIGDRFGGVEARRVQRGSDEVKVMIKDRLQSRNSLSDIMNLRVQNDQGQWFPITAVADIQSSYVTDYVARRDSQRVNTIYVRLNKALLSPSELGAQLFNGMTEDLEARFPEVKIKQAGELEEIFTVKNNLVKALIFTCVLIYVLLAIPLKSYSQPFIIMSVIPFGFVGAAIGHLIMDVPLSLLSFFGMLALAGVVVNDSLVMLTRFNQASAEGLTIHQALSEAGLGRFKAFFLTTTTTVAGLTPLMLETSEQAQYLIPAAISLAFGELFATAITLILIPVLIAIGQDVKGVWTSISTPLTTDKQDDVLPSTKHSNAHPDKNKENTHVVNELTY
ncbi:efflux RND transporter permease subunit [Litoribacillus peritrichatus]|uniref:Efflux RND transporter permease subunit n=1 Tax=Litoribacillus peritrichatus TaxID=718191 RepID=A0ABP7MXK5_9GAMM